MMDNENIGKKYTPRQALLKAQSYCAYQERSQQEVRDKLYSWGLHYADVEQTIAELIAENFLNEERFAIAYTLGKFRMKGWGKIKIKQHLKHKNVSEPLIKIALQQIDLDEYYQKLDDLIEKKVPSVRDLSINDKNKLIRFLQTKGFESNLIFERVLDRN